MYYSLEHIERGLRIESVLSERSVGASEPTDGRTRATVAVTAMVWRREAAIMSSNIARPR